MRQSQSDKTVFALRRSPAVSAGGISGGLSASAAQVVLARHFLALFGGEQVILLHKFSPVRCFMFVLLPLDHVNDVKAYTAPLCKKSGLILGVFLEKVA